MTRLVALIPTPTRIFARLRAVNIKRIATGLILYISLFIMIFYGFKTAVDVAGYYPSLSLRYNNNISPATAADARRWAAGNDAAFWPTFWSQQQASFESDLKKSSALCIWYSGDATLVWPMRFINGTYPGQADTEGVAVSRKLAWQLWGGVDVVGQFVEIEGQRYIVRGVFEGDEPLALAGTTDGGYAPGWQGVELAPNPLYKGGADAKAQSFTAASGLGSPDTVVAGRAISGMAAFAAWLAPVMLLVAAAVCILSALARRGKGGAFARARREAIIFALLLVLALALPWILSVISPSLIPSQWSDFSFWGALGASWLAQLREFLSLNPLLQDIEVKLLLLRQVLLVFGSVLLGSIAVRRMLRGQAPPQ